MAGPLALVGGAEFRPPCDPVDQTLLGLLGLSSARVVIVPTAAANQRPDLAAANGVRHFQRLGAAAQATMIVDPRTANDATLVVSLHSADLIYLAGGDPSYLLRTLRDSLAWSTILQAHERGAALVGSSAGAMVLCQQLRWGGPPALGIAPIAAVVPHYAGTAVAPLGRVPDLPALGIAESTAALLHEGSGRVLGPGRVTLLRPNAPAQSYAAGEQFELNNA